MEHKEMRIPFKLMREDISGWEAGKEKEALEKTSHLSSLTGCLKKLSERANLNFFKLRISSSATLQNDISFQVLDEEYFCLGPEIQGWISLTPLLLSSVLKMWFLFTLSWKANDFYINGVYEELSTLHIIRANGRGKLSVIQNAKVLFLDTHGFSLCLWI